MNDREQMQKLAGKIRTALDHGHCTYLLIGAELDWVIIALRSLAHGQLGRKE